MSAAGTGVGPKVSAALRGTKRRVRQVRAGWWVASLDPSTPLGPFAPMYWCRVVSVSERLFDGGRRGVRLVLADGHEIDADPSEPAWTYTSAEARTAGLATKAGAR